MAALIGEAMTEKENLAKRLVELEAMHTLDGDTCSCGERIPEGIYIFTDHRKYAAITTHTEEAVKLAGINEDMARGIFTEIREFLESYPCMHESDNNRKTTPPMMFREWIACVMCKLKEQGEEAVAVRTEECAEILQKEIDTLNQFAARSNQPTRTHYAKQASDLMILRDKIRSLSPNHTEALRRIEERAREPHKLKLSRIVGILSMPAPGRMCCPFCKSSVNPMPGMPDGLVLAHQDSCIIEEARALLAEGKEKE